LVHSFYRYCRNYARIQGYRDLADWAEFHQELLASLSSFQPKSIPSSSTIRRAIVGIDCDDFIVQFNEWAAKLLPDTPEMSGLSIDGKSLRSTLTNYRSEKQNFVAIVSAFCHQTNLVLALGKLENRKTSEAPCVRHISELCRFKTKQLPWMLSTVIKRQFRPFKTVKMNI
jgi:hypothetical protein